MASTSDVPRTVERYLSALSDEERIALEKLRRTIMAAAPGAVESVTYGVPGFRLAGKPLVAYGAAKGHCAFYLMSDSTLSGFSADLKNLDTSKGTIRFAPGKPLPSALIRKLVNARMAEILGKNRVPPSSKARAQAAADRASGSHTDSGAAAFMRQLDHPLKKDIEFVRRVILGVRPKGPRRIMEDVKWNAPSFHTAETDFFATFFLRDHDSVRLILHTGAKAKRGAKSTMTLADPGGLVKWLAKDRCMVSIGAGKEVRKHRAAIESIIGQWLEQI